jgi:hypothetical protein
MASFRLFAIASFATLVSLGCSGGDRAASEPQKQETTLVQLVSASAGLRGKCRATARSVGYAVPCPTRVPPNLVATPGHHGCRLGIIGPGGRGDRGTPWRGWVVGSSETADQHLVIVASPRPIRNDAKVVNGPGWYPAARVRPLRRLTINGWRMRAVYVPSATNAGSAVADHVVLIWAVDGHTYAVGFHNVDGLRRTLELDVALARAIELVGP